MSQLLSLACALLALCCHAALSQEVPILPAPASIPRLSATVSGDSSKESPSGGLHFGIVTTSVPSSVNVDGRPLEWTVVAEVADPELPYRYATARVLNVPQSYARFLIAGDRVVGTVVTPEAIYRLLPTGSGQVSVHRLAADGGADPRFRQITDPANAGDRALERRHVQLERLAQIQPRRVFIVDAGRYFRGEGGDFGKLAAAPTASAVVAAMRNIAELTYPPEPLDLQISRVTKYPRGTQVEFRQTINGIALFATNELLLDSDGTIVDLTTHFVDPAWASDRPVLPEAEARKVAVRRIETETGSRVLEYELIAPTTLWYKVETGPRLVPYYTFSLRALPDDKAFGVVVDAQSGESRLVVNPTAALTQRASVRLAARIR